MTAAESNKVNITTDGLASHAYVMSRLEKDLVDTAVREYIDIHRDDINSGSQNGAQSTQQP